MKRFVQSLLALSVAFGIFSIYYGIEYGNLGQRYRGVDMRNELIDLAQEKTLLLVKAVSIPYFLLCLGFFARMMFRTGRRIVPVTAVVVCLIMIAWSLLLSQAVSFDEVFPAWVAAAVVLAGLLLPELRVPAGEATGEA